ncbi:MAG: N-acetyltransferase [Sphingomonas sp.]
MQRFVPLSEIDPAAVEHMLDRAFGANRRSRTAYRLREGAAPLPALSFAVVEQSELLGTIQCWPVLFESDAGGRLPMTMVGPVAVAPERQAEGIGKRLMSRALDAADTAGLGDALMLVGDPEYYGRFFGFTTERTGGWRLPGPVDAHRLLARGNDVPDEAGIVAPRIATRA